MNQSMITEKLEKLFQDKKTQNFVLHLVRSYLPLNKTKKVWEKPKDLKKFKCALADNKLISIDEVFGYINSDESFSAFQENLKSISQSFRLDKPASSDLMGLEKFLNGRVLGFQGENTTTYLSEAGVIALYDWVAIKILNEDGKIKWTLRQMGAGSFSNQFAKPKPLKAKLPKPKKATSTLGDFDALQKLRAKLTADESSTSTGK